MCIFTSWQSKQLLAPYIIEIIHYFECSIWALLVLVIYLTEAQLTVSSFEFNGYGKNEELWPFPSSACHALNIINFIHLRPCLVWEQNQSHTTDEQ